MQRSTVLEKLTRYFAQDVLSGEDAGLDETTPLLEWGIINSIELPKLLHFIHQQFAIDIPPDKLEADSFTTISSIADLVINTVQLNTNGNYSGTPLAPPQAALGKGRSLRGHPAPRQGD